MASGGVGRILVDCGEPVRTEAGPKEEAPVEAVAGPSSAQEPASLLAHERTFDAADVADALTESAEAEAASGPPAQAPVEAAPEAADLMIDPAEAMTMAAEGIKDVRPGAQPQAAPPDAATPAPVAAEAATTAEDHYRVLGLAPRASREQIERAYQFCRDMYGPGSLATYSLLEPQEVEASRARIDEAYHVLADAGQRRSYDEALGVGVGPDPAWYLPEPVDRGPEPIALPEVVTGAVLRRIRETRGISLRQIANASKVGVRYLEYIEQDRHAYLPAPVYLRGFLQEYARMVGLDPRRVTESYLSQIGRRA
jgi:flagellar biosynthesis protein FlhG